MSITIPNSGNLGRIAKNIKEKYNEELLNKMFKDYSTSLSGAKRAEWILKMIQKLENDIGLENTINILEKSGRQSCTNNFKNTIKKLMKESSSNKEFVEKLQERYKRSSFFELIDNNTIIGGHRKCYDIIKSAPKPIDTQNYCHVCVGHGKEFYETAFGNSVDIEIIETIMTGGDTCKFRIKF